MKRFIVMESAAVVRGRMRQFGRYRRVAVVEITPEMAAAGDRPKMISERARGLVRIVEEWGPVNQGKTERSAYYLAIREAEEMAGELNAQI